MVSYSGYAWVPTRPTKKVPPPHLKHHRQNHPRAVLLIATNLPQQRHLSVTLPPSTRDCFRAPLTLCLSTTTATNHHRRRTDHVRIFTNQWRIWPDSTTRWIWRLSSPPCSGTSRNVKSDCNERDRNSLTMLPLTEQWRNCRVNIWLLLLMPLCSLIDISSELFI